MFRTSRWGLFTLLLVWPILMPTAPVAAATDLLPDLAVTRLRDLRIDATSAGHRLLRFTVVSVNIGAGAFEVRGRRPDTASPMTVEQRIFNDAGSSHYTTTPATMFFAGDGHEHWHVRNFLRYWLYRRDDGILVGTGAKSGFCFVDNEAFGALTDPVYTAYNSCSYGSASTLQTTMGLSVGWGDRYTWNLPDQYIDITGLPPGPYRLLAIADLSNGFRETDAFNNHTWVDLQITEIGVTIESYGPFPTPLGSNLLRNRSFDVDANGDSRPDNWGSRRAQNGKFTQSSEAVYAGSYAGRHYATDNSGYTIAQTAYNITQGTTYTFSGYINIPGTSDAFTFQLQVRWLNVSNTTISTQSLATYTDDTNGAWEQMTAVLVAPTGAHGAQVRMQVQSLHAAIYVDDFAFGPQ
jgi:Lysyl oxidase